MERYINITMLFLKKRFNRFFEHEISSQSSAMPNDKIKNQKVKS